MNKRKFSGGFSLVEFFLGCVILAIITMGMAATLSYFSKSGSRMSNNSRIAALSELLRSEVVAQTRGDNWYTMSSSVTATTRTGFPNLVYDQTVFDIQSNARHVITKISRLDTQGNPELMKVDDYKVSPRSGITHAARIRIIATRDLDNSPAGGITASAPPAEGTVMSECMSADGNPGTDDITGQCVIEDVQVGSVDVVVLSGAKFYFQSPIPPEPRHYTVVTSSGQQTDRPVTVSKKNLLIVRTYERNTTGFLPPTGTNQLSHPLNGVYLYLEGTGLPTTSHVDGHASDYTTGNGGNSPGEYREYVYPGNWRVTAMGTVDGTRAAVDFPESKVSPSGYAPLALNGQDLVRTFFLPLTGSVSGHVYKFNFVPGTPGTYQLTTNGVNNVKVSYSQMDMRLLHSNTFSPEPNTTPDLDPWERYMNNTVTNVNRYCGYTEPYQYCPKWPQPFDVTDSGGNYTVNNVGPLIVNKAPGSTEVADFSIPTKPEDARSWIRYWPDSHVGGGATPIAYRAAGGTTPPTTRANSIFFLSYDGINNWDSYPRTGNYVYWFFYQRLLAATTNTNQKIYLLAYNAANFLQIAVTLMSGGSIWSPASGSYNKATLQLWIPNATAPAPPWHASDGVSFDAVSYVTSSNGIQTLHGPVTNQPALVRPQIVSVFGFTTDQHGNTTAPYLYIVPPLGNNKLLLQYASGDFVTPRPACTYNFTVGVISNVPSGSGFNNQLDWGADLTPHINIQSLTPLGDSMTSPFITQTLTVTNGAASFLDHRNAANVYYANKLIQDDADLDPTGGVLDVQLDVPAVTPASTPFHVVNVTGSENTSYRAVLDQNASAGTQFPLSFSSPPTGDTYSGTLYFVMQKLLRFAGYVYDTGTSLHTVPKNPPVQINIIYKQPRTPDGNTEITPPVLIPVSLTSMNTTSITGMTACGVPPCPSNPNIPQYLYDAWVPMVNSPWHWRIRVSDPSGHRFQAIDSPLYPLTTNTPSSPAVQQFDAPLVRVAGYGG